MKKIEEVSKKKESPGQNRFKNDRRKKPNDRRGGPRIEKEFDKEAWKPKTSLGMKVKSGEIDDIDHLELFVSRHAGVPFSVSIA